MVRLKNVRFPAEGIIKISKVHHKVTQITNTLQVFFHHQYSKKSQDFGRNFFLSQMITTDFFTLLTIEKVVQSTCDLSEVKPLSRTDTLPYSKFLMLTITAMVTMISLKLHLTISRGGYYL
jgi:hypothetical protein